MSKCTTVEHKHTKTYASGEKHIVNVNSGSQMRSMKGALPFRNITVSIPAVK